MTTIDDMVGLTITKIAMIDDSQNAVIVFQPHIVVELVFETSNGIYRMYHFQDCCEEVYLEDIAGDLNDLIGTPIVAAYEKSNRETVRFGVDEWTFYTLQTAKGTIVLRWYGTSNGMYATGIDIAKDEPR